MFHQSFTEQNKTKQNIILSVGSSVIKSSKSLMKSNRGFTTLAPSKVQNINFNSGLKEPLSLMDSGKHPLCQMASIEGFAFS